MGWGGGWGFSGARKPEPENRSQKTGAARLLQARRVVGEAVFNEPNVSLESSQERPWSPQMTPGTSQVSPESSQVDLAHRRPIKYMF